MEPRIVWRGRKRPFFSPLAFSRESWRAFIRAIRRAFRNMRPRKIKPKTRSTVMTTFIWKVATSSTFNFISLSRKAKINLSNKAPIPIPAPTVRIPNSTNSLKVILIRWRFSKPNMPYIPSSLERFFMTKLLA
ncbi:Uncharacterised protein [Streptococcus pneumoniae]|nr:Uncharacterised protein [Streptococcus pneumoniae]CIV94041.1 Uncharacterised protein [Streptococcus pneumoniae]CIW13026.1 Uncharacterised protein [Streptococcus pneumoniae]CKF87677.1 Uncharacterised protein [Streptococcus pneumoniae]CKI12337.1 Uncharacterised protein [Streptococcus pneumoniae]